VRGICGRRNRRPCAGRRALRRPDIGLAAFDEIGAGLRDNGGEQPPVLVDCDTCYAT
jgi:hypothetical protein